MGTYNDDLYTFLGNRGYSGTLNDRLFKYYIDVGYTGTLSDMAAAIRREFNIYNDPFPIVTSFLTFDGVGSYAEFVEPVALLNGTHYFPFAFSPAATANYQRIAESSDGRLKILIHPDGRVYATVSDGITTKTCLVSGDYSDGKIYTAELTISGDDYSLAISSASSAVQTLAGVTKDIAVLGTTATATASFWPGQLLDPVLNGQSHPISNGSTLYELLPGSSLGSELVTNGTFDSDLSGWDSAINWGWESPGVSRHIPGATNSMVQNILEIGSTYLMTYTVGGITAGDVRIRAGSGTSGVYRSSSGTYTEVLQCSGNTELLISPSSTFDGYVDNISVRKLPSTALIYHGVSAAHWEKFKRTYNPDAWTALDGDPVLEIA